MRPPLDGAQVMERLGLPPGPQVGEALAYLMEHRMERGPIEEAEAFALLDAWAGSARTPRLRLRPWRHEGLAAGRVVGSQALAAGAARRRGRPSPSAPRPRCPPERRGEATSERRHTASSTAIAPSRAVQHGVPRPDGRLVDHREGQQERGGPAHTISRVASDSP